MSSRAQPLAWGTWALLLFLGGTVGHCQDPAQELAALRQRLEAQEQRIRNLEEQSGKPAPVAMADQTPWPSEPAKPPLQYGDEQRGRTDCPSVPQGSEPASKPSAASPASCAPRIADADKRFTFRITGRVMADYVMYPWQDAANRAAVGDLSNYFEFRRIWLAASGEGYGVYEYKIEVDFEPEAGPEDSAVAMKDVFLGIMNVPLLGWVRVGNQKEPFSLENINSSRYITFLEHGLPKVFSPTFGTGITAWNHSQDESLVWAWGVFLNDIPELTKERLDDRQGLNAEVRLTWSPWYADEGRRLLHLGVGYGFVEDFDDLLRFATRPEVHENPYFVDTGWFAADYFHRLNTETAAVLGPFSVQSELFAVQTRGTSGQPDHRFYGAYAFVSFFLTGEHRNYWRTRGIFTEVKPFTNFYLTKTAEGTQIGWGAWEVAARWSYVQLDDSGLTSPRRGQLHDLTLGLNWYWTPQIRWTLNWIHAFGNRADVGHNQADIVGIRGQFDF